jgi:O-antigen/teichoic acid export membrane protein
MSLKKNTIANYIGTFYVMFIGIFMLPFYLKYMGAEAYGLVGFFTMLLSWMLLLDMGFSTALSREVAKLKDKANGILEIKLTLRGVEALIFILSIVVFFGIYFLSGWIALNWLHIENLPYETVEQCIKLMGFMVALRWFVSLYSGLIVGFEQQIWLNTYRILIETLRFVGGLILVVFISDDVFYFFIYQAFIAIIQLFLVNKKVYKNLPDSDFIIPSISHIKKIAPFALSLAYTSGVWIVFTQLDKLLLSHYIPLNEYGYFSLVVVILAAIMQISTPLSSAILPRMTSLLSHDKEQEMLLLYRRGTQFVAIVIFSVVGIVSFYSYELLYAWTGDAKAAAWASPVLFWYAWGNGVLALLAFQYYLQFAYGNLKYHVKFNTYFPLIALPLVFFAIKLYGALGAGVAWFIIQSATFFIWPPFVHSKFARGIHKDWLVKDIFPSLSVTVAFLLLLNTIKNVPVLVSKETSDTVDMKNIPSPAAAP